MKKLTALKLEWIIRKPKILLLGNMDINQVACLHQQLTEILLLLAHSDIYQLQMPASSHTSSFDTEHKL